MPPAFGSSFTSPPTHTDVLAAESGPLSSVEDTINTVFEPISDGFSNLVFGELTLFGVTFPWIVAWLAIAAAVFTVAFGFIQFRSLGLSVALLRGKYSRDDDPGEITHFQALSSAVSATVGLGNIAGVGVAVTVGGAGATFWMIVAGFLSMTTKFAECTLGVKYRRENADGTVSGGPMFYLSRGLAQQGMVGLGTFLAAAFAVFCIFGSLGGGNAPLKVAMAKSLNIQAVHTLDMIGIQTGAQMVRRFGIRLGIPVFPGTQLTFTGAVDDVLRGPSYAELSVSFAATSPVGTHLSGTATLRRPA